MAKARALEKRRRSVRSIQKITRTMELIARARFKKTMDRATAATAYTKRITQLVADLAKSGLEVSHPLLDPRPETNGAALLVLTANRGLCGAYNAAVIRLALSQLRELQEGYANVRLVVSGRRGISAMRFRKVPLAQGYTHFEDKPRFEEVEILAARYLEEYLSHALDRLDVVYTKFISTSRQVATVETLLPLESLQADTDRGEDSRRTDAWKYEFLPSAASILEEVVPASFKVRLFKCFLDAAVSEQTSRMVAMKAATENAQDMIRQLSMTYNRARQSQITNDILEVIGGAEALKG
jgi:F-type H+-transporting ATPase subunit gamma